MRELLFRDLIGLVKARPRHQIPVRIFPDQVGPGDIYVAYTAKWARASIDVPLALERGAAVVVAETETRADAGDSHAALCIVPSATEAYAELTAASEAGGRPRLHLYGITGTKGKTTVAHLLRSVLAHAGFVAGALCTHRATWPGENCETDCTTPEPRVLHDILGRMSGGGVTHVVLEASSIGLAEHRLAALTCDAAVWTNTGSDHISYHGGMAEYVRAKTRLFSHHLDPRGFAVINAEDLAADRATADLGPRRRTFGIAAGDTRGEVLSMLPEGMVLRANGYRIRTSLVGMHNASNVCAAVAVAEELGISPANIRDGIGAVAQVPGRFEQLSAGSLDVIVDYAHTPESVDAVLRTIRALWPARRLATVLGAGGGTDRAKRAPMAARAARHADLLVLTEDNSRNEPVSRILWDLAGGLPPGTRCRTVLPRAAAIAAAVNWCQPDGVVAVLGRGDEHRPGSGVTRSGGADAAVVRELLGTGPSHAGQNRMQRL